MHKQPPKGAKVERYSKCSVCGERLPVYRDGDNLVSNLSGCPALTSSVRIAKRVLKA